MNNRKRERGQSVVEMALLFPLLVILLMGVVDVGRAYYILVAINDAASEGAIYASVDPSNVSEIQRRTSEATTGLVVIDPASVSVTYPSGVAIGQPVNVVVQQPMELLMPMMESLFPEGQVVLRGEATQAIIMP